jgi:hypothetical protein
MDLAQRTNFQRETRFRIDGKTVDEYNADVDSSGLQFGQQAMTMCSHSWMKRRSSPN